MGLHMYYIVIGAERIVTTGTWSQVLPCLPLPCPTPRPREGLAGTVVWQAGSSASSCCSPESLQVWAHAAVVRTYLCQAPCLSPLANSLVTRVPRRDPASCHPDVGTKNDGLQLASCVPASAVQEVVCLHRGCCSLRAVHRYFGLPLATPTATCRSTGSGGTRGGTLPAATLM